MPRRLRQPTPAEELAFLRVQYQVLLEARPPHLIRQRAQRLARLRARLSELEAAAEPQTFRLAERLPGRRDP